MIPAHKYSSREVMEQLSFREFSALCALVDEFGPKTQICAQVSYGFAGGGKFPTVDGVLIQKRFDVLQVRREDEKLSVWLDFGKGKLQWYELTPAKEKALVLPKSRLEAA